jgi:hypothetical protein
MACHGRPWKQTNKQTKYTMLRKEIVLNHDLQQQQQMFFIIEVLCNAIFINHSNVCPGF